MLINKLPFLFIFLQYLCCSFHTVWGAAIKSKLEEDIHKRVKRQYFKPTIDGSWLSNERTITLKSNKHNQMIFDIPQSQLNDQNNEQYNIKSNKINNNNVKSNQNVTSTIKLQQSGGVTKNEITVANLAISLISLFDRIKCTLYNVINQECKN